MNEATRRSFYPPSYFPQANETGPEPVIFGGQDASIGGHDVSFASLDGQDASFGVHALDFEGEDMEEPRAQAPILNDF